VKRSILGVLLVLTFVAVGIASAPPLTFTFSDVHANKTAIETDSYAVNNAGVIAGDYIDSAGVQHGMILAGKKLTTIDNKSCSSSISFYGINSAGTLAGWCFNSAGNPIGFTWAKGKFTNLKYPKAVGTEGIGINDKGDVVGLFLDSSGVSHGYLFSNKKYTEINVKGASNSDAWAINNAGEITVSGGTSVSSGQLLCPCTSFLLKGKKFTPVADPNQGSDGTGIHGVNNKGDIDGTYYDSAANRHGFLLHGGKYYDVNDPNGPTATRADGINDSLEMVGRYTNSAGGTLGFKATTK